MAHDVPQSTRRRHVVRRTGATPSYRRSPALISYWQDGKLLLENYVRREKTEATPIVLEVLDALTDWQPPAALHARLKKIPPALIDDLLEALVTHGLIDRDEQERADGGRTAALDTWKSWTPAATYFHLATKDVAFTPRAETNRALKKRAIDIAAAAAPEGSGRIRGRTHRVAGAGEERIECSERSERARMRRPRLTVSRTSSRSGAPGGASARARSHSMNSARCSG